MESLLMFTLELGMLVAALIFLYIKLFSPFNFWKKLGVPYVKPGYFIVGDLNFMLMSIEELCKYWYNNYPNEKFYGVFQLWKPALIVKDPELAENILIKDFSHAYNRFNVVDPDMNDLSKHLVNYKDEKWKRLRNKLTPTFTSGKLKFMHPQLVKLGNTLVEYVAKNEGEIQVKDLFGRFSMDVVLTVAFGLDEDVINNPDSPFYELGKTTFSPSRTLRIFFALQTFLTPIFKKLGIRKLTKGMELFMDAVKQNMEYREKNNVIRQDFLQLLIELKKKDEELVKNKELEPNSADVFDEIAISSNSFLFYAAGYETTGTTLTFLFYEIAKQQEIQEKLYQEIKTVLAKHNGELSFEAITEMIYLDQVINETMRLHPAGVALDREITKDYHIPDSDVVLPAGTPVIIQVYGLHRDPRYYPDPEVFRPERFDPDKNEIGRGTFLPFGAGPRVCIAARFAKVEMKVCAASLLKNFKVSSCPRTLIPMQYDPKSFMLTPLDSSVWLKFEKRRD